MVSSFGWLALDPEQRRRMMEAVDQFRDETTIDDLGFGAIRDSFADALFPGTSTIQTRLRYALFIPWLLQEASHRQTVAGMQAMFRGYEYQLIGALKRGGESQGVIGVTAGRSLRRMASEIYWGSMLRWRITEPGVEVSSFLCKGPVDQSFCRVVRGGVCWGTGRRKRSALGAIPGCRCRALRRGGFRCSGCPGRPA